MNKVGRETSHQAKHKNNPKKKKNSHKKMADKLLDLGT